MGYRQALKDYQLQENKQLELLLDIEQANYEGAKEAINQLIKNNIPFDGVFATNDWRAYGVLVGLLENNVKVPDEVKIIGFDDIFISASSHPSLSTIKQNIPALTKTACSLLLDLMNDIAINDEKSNLFCQSKLFDEIQLVDYNTLLNLYVICSLLKNK